MSHSRANVKGMFTSLLIGCKNRLTQSLYMCMVILKLEQFTNSLLDSGLENSFIPFFLEAFFNCFFVCSSFSPISSLKTYVDLRPLLI
jgi:hypothetical protein